MRPVGPVVLCAAGLLAGGTPPSVFTGGDVFPMVRWHDNLRPAGTVRHGVTAVEMEIVEATWEPAGAEGGHAPILAFREQGGEAEIPGPMIRVAEGTVLQVTVTNTLDTTIVVHGLSPRRQATMDSLLLLPRTRATASFVADAEGTYYYWGGYPGTTVATRLYEDSQLSGAFIVDPAGATPPPVDRVLLIGMWVQARDSAGDPDDSGEFFTINGRPWPKTERFTYAVGDSVRWRLINASGKVHPMHLHGFYYRVDARGNAARDTTYRTADRRMVVTERMLPGTTMRMVFSPDRPGGWIFHCHLNWHVAANPGVGTLRPTVSQRAMQLFMDHPVDPDHHVERGMGGLLIAMQIHPAPGWVPPAEGPRRRLDLFIQSDSTPRDSIRRYGYVLQEGAPPAPDSTRSPGSTIVLHRGEPTTITVHNRTPQPSAVHWHGLEIESPFDGVAGIGGYAASPAPALQPGGTFDVHVTPPRSGSFMYHTHINDLLQQSRGLWGALIVLDSGETWNPDRDRIYQIGEGTDFQPILNGRTEHPVEELHAATAYRFRLMNISMGGPNLMFRLVAADTTDPVRWIPVAKDGYDLPQARQMPVDAQQPLSIGETCDMLVQFATPGEYALEVLRGDGTLVTRQRFRVGARR